MDNYKSDLQHISCDIDTIFSKLSNPQIIKQQIEKNRDKLPQQAIDNLDKVTFEADGISISSPMGPVKLAVEKGEAPNRVVYAAKQSPVPFTLAIDLTRIDDQHTDAQADLQIDLPIFVRGMVGGHLKNGAKQLGELLAHLPYRDL